MEITTALQSEQHVKKELAKKLGQLQEKLGELKEMVTYPPHQLRKPGGQTYLLGGWEVAQDGAAPACGGTPDSRVLPILPVVQAPCHSQLSDSTEWVSLG